MDTSSYKLRKIAHYVTWKLLGKGNMTRETYSLLTATLNSAVRTNVEVKIDSE